jgi:hypothetical protein
MKHFRPTSLRAAAVALALLVVDPGAATTRPHAAPSPSTRSCLPGGDADPAELAELAAAVNLLGRAAPLGGYFARLLTESELDICLDPSCIDCRGYFEPQEHKIGIGGGLSRWEMTLILAHELRHLDQNRRGFVPSLTISMSENIRLSFAMEADAQAIATLLAWSAHEAGDLTLWRALEALERAEDIAAAFADAVTAGATPAGATRAAFSAWYGSPWRLERYGAAAAASHLDRLDETKAFPSAAALPRDYFDRMCLMPDGGNYGCHLTEEIAVKNGTRR